MVTSIVLVILIISVFSWGNMLEDMHHCQGIDNFYTGEGFQEDYARMMQMAVFSGPELPKPPLAIWNREPVDCDTMSVAISCLSELYNDTECAYYSEVMFDQTFEGEHHLGVKCRKLLHEENNSVIYGSWFKYF